MKIVFVLLALAATITSCSDVKTHKIKEKPSIPFTWNFNTNSKIEYSFEQKSISNSMFSKEEDMHKSNIEMTAEMFIEVQDSMRANVGLRNIKSVIYDLNDDGSKTKSGSQDQPMFMTEGMSNKSEFEDLNAAMLFQSLFPLPLDKIKEGETVEIPMKIPFNAAGSRLFIKGSIQLTYTENKTFRRTKCAVLKGVIKASDIDIPKEIAKDYTISLEGEGVYYFDQKRGLFVGGNVEETFIIDLEASDKMAEEFMSNISMTSTSEYSYRLKSVEKG